MLLLFYRAHGRFPRRAAEIEAEAITTVARQIDASSEPFDAMDMSDRTLKRQRAEIRSLLGFREATVADGETLTEWLRDHAVADCRDIDELTSVLEQRCRDLKIEPPGVDRIERIVRAARMTSASAAKSMVDCRPQREPGSMPCSVRPRPIRRLPPAKSPTVTFLRY